MSTASIPADRASGYAQYLESKTVEHEHGAYYLTPDGAERIAAPLSGEQTQALKVLTGPERVAVLVGPAGTGKGVVIDATARAEQLAAHETIGVAVSWSTAERPGSDSPALHGQTMALDALITRAQAGHVHVGPDTTIILDEAGMIDHTRMAALTQLVERTGAKLIAVGDGKQLPSIGPGGMFDRIARHAPTAELQTIHRTKDPAEQHAWRAIRNGEPERALAHYASRNALHLADTRSQAAENAVQAWAKLAQNTPSATSHSSPTPPTKRSTASTPAPNTYATNTANSDNTKPNSPTSTTASTKATSSRSPTNTAHPRHPASRTAPAAKSPACTPTAM